MLYNAEEKEGHSFNQIITFSFSFATLAKSRVARLHRKEILKKRNKSKLSHKNIMSSKSKLLSKNKSTLQSFWMPIELVRRQTTPSWFTKVLVWYGYIFFFGFCFCFCFCVFGNLGTFFYAKITKSVTACGTCMLVWYCNSNIGRQLIDHLPFLFHHPIDLHTVFLTSLSIHNCQFEYLFYILP